MCRRLALAQLPSRRARREMFSLRRVVAILLLVIFAAMPAIARTLVFKHFDAQVQMHPDGTIDVTEVIEAQFTGVWHGIYRSIPVEYTDDAGLNYTLLLDQINATDSEGQKLKLEQNREGRNIKFKIYVPAAEDATRTILLHYRVLDALRFFQDHDELDWNVTGNEWQDPIELVTAHIELPAGVTGLHAIAYTGVNNSRTEDARIEISDNIVDIRSTRRLGYRQGLTAVVGFDKGFAQSNSPLLIPVVAFFVMLWLWWTRGRDPQRQAISVQYEPPDKLTPGECGTLVDNEAAMRDITATLVDLAVKGYLTIEQKEESHLLGLTHSKDYIFHMKKTPTEWAAARSHEQEMLSALFDAGASPDVNLSALQNHFYTRLPAIRDRIFSALMKDGYYLHRPDTVKQGYIGAGLVIGGLLVFGGVGYFQNATGIAAGSWISAGIASGLVICIFGWFMPARTVTGARALEKVLGFEEFLGRVEKDQIERLEKTPELFEKYLPYAMALRVEKKWVQAFSGIALQPPQWYQGYYGGNFTAFYLVNDLNMMSMQAGSVMASAPRSSGGSGFGGGGGSGGGFGGGGGGGF
jgi:uncharacterized membrane protein